MIPKRPAGPVCLALVLMPTALVCLTTQKGEGLLTPDVSKLEYRLAEPSDALLEDKTQLDAGVFAAVDTRHNVVVGSVEFGLVNQTDGDLDTVYIPIHQVAPQVTFAWMRVDNTNEAAIKAYKKAGFEEYDSADWGWLNFFYDFPEGFENNPAVVGNGSLPFSYMMSGDTERVLSTASIKKGYSWTDLYGNECFYYKDPMKGAIPFILLQELCERLACYGLTPNLQTFLKEYLGYTDTSANSYISSFNSILY
ncbi:hypothetical protein FOZ62_023345, partial [Perkinsus olseni]